MILVTLGTGDKPFPRLLEAIEKEIEKGNIKDEVVVQAGSTKFESKYMKIFDLIPIDKFNELIDKCDLLITHGGVGSITTGLKCNKKIIGVARLKKYGEVANDHQLQILDNFDKEGLILHLENLDDLSKKIKEAENFTPKKYKSNTENFIDFISKEIDSTKNRNTKNFVNLLFVISILCFCTLCMIKSIIKPINIVQNENRYANKYDKIDFNSYISGDMQDNFESTLSDQLILSSKMKSLNNYLNAKIMDGALNLIVNENNSYNYYNIGSFSVFGKYYLVYSPYDLETYKNDLNSKITSLNKTMEMYPDVDYYFYYIEKDTDINFLDNSKLLAYEYIKDNLNSSNIARFEINSFDGYKKYFYKTDHHWNYMGSYKGYTEVLDLLELKNPKKIEGLKCLKNRFSGSKGSQMSTHVYNEEFCAYTFDFENIDTTINGSKKDYGNQEAYLNGEIPTISYGEFYGDDEGETIFDTKDSSKDNILVIGESFDNAILKLLAEKFNKTISIDLRHYEHYFGEKFDYGKYLEKYDIDKVLFIGNIGFWISSEFNVIE